MKLYILALIIISVIISCGCLFKYREGLDKSAVQYAMEDKMLKHQDKYFRKRVFPNVAPGSAESSFVDVPDIEDNNQKKLKNVKIGAYVPPSDVDKNVKKCEVLNSTQNCAYLKGTKCGYCHSNKSFFYGDDNGPLVNSCPGGKAAWVGPNDKRGTDWVCQKLKDQETCKAVKNCGGSTGTASICAWCPTTQSGMVYEKNSSGGFKPKYDDDKCAFNGELTVKNKKITTSLINIRDCAAFRQLYPCMGPNWSTGPHTQACVQKKWSEAGCSGEANSRISRSGLNASKINKWWNSHGHGAMLDNMKSIRVKQSSSDYDTAKKYTKACSGIDIDPCQSRFKERPFNCDKQIYTGSGCNKRGKLNPESNEPWAIDLPNPYTKYKSKNNRNSGELSNLKKEVNYMKNRADHHKRNLKEDYGKTIKYNMACYGDVPSAPWKKPCWKDFSDMMIYIRGVSLPRSDELHFGNIGNRYESWIEMKKTSVKADTNMYPRWYNDYIVRKNTYRLADFPYWNFLTKMLPYLKTSSSNTGISWYSNFIPEMIKVPGVIRVGTDKWARKRGHLVKRGHDELWFSQYSPFHRLISGYGFPTIAYKGTRYTRLWQSRYKAKAGEHNMDYGFPYWDFFRAAKAS